MISGLINPLIANVFDPGARIKKSPVNMLLRLLFPEKMFCMSQSIVPDPVRATVVVMVNVPRLLVTLMDADDENPAKVISGRASKSVGLLIVMPFVIADAVFPLVRNRCGLQLSVIEMLAALFSLTGLKLTSFPIASLKCVVSKLSVSSLYSFPDRIQFRMPCAFPMKASAINPGYLTSMFLYL